MNSGNLFETNLCGIIKLKNHVYYDIMMSYNLRLNKNFKFKKLIFYSSLCNNNKFANRIFFLNQTLNVLD